MNATKLDKFTQAYIECALWSSTDDNGTPLDRNYDESDLSPQALEQMAKDCADFQDKNRHYIAGLSEQAGHDFWLTRNQHGAGFWDGDWPEQVDDALTNAAHAFGSCDLYVGDDGQLYVS